MILEAVLFGFIGSLTPWNVARLLTLATRPLPLLATTETMKMHVLLFLLPPFTEVMQIA
jgi:hypothetical protein